MTVLCAGAWIGRGDINALLGKASALEADIVLDRLCLFHQAEAGAPFTRQADFPLRARQDNG